MLDVTGADHGLKEKRAFHHCVNNF